MQGDGHTIRFSTLLAESSDFDLIDNVFMRIVTYYGEGEVVAGTTREEAVVVLTWNTSGIIDNGGFEYLFREWHFSYDPDFSRTAEAFRIVGLERSHQAFREAFALFPGGKAPRDPRRRARLYEQAEEARRDEVNTKFWQDFREGDIRERTLAQYIREHALAFAHLYG